MLAATLTMSSVISFAPFRAQVYASPEPQRGFSPEQVRALRELAPKLSRLDIDRNGVPSWMLGDLGAATGDSNAAALEAMRRLAPAFRMTADDSFDVRKSERDEEGQTHVRLRQRYRDLLVVDHEVIVHLDDDKVVGVNGHFTADINVGSTASLTAETALAIARRSLSSSAVSELSAPELVVFVTPDNIPHLAWRQKVTYNDAEGLQRDWIFADARIGQLLGRHSLINTAKFRKIYDGNQQCLTSLNQLPGTFLFDENVSILQLFYASASAKGAFSGTGRTYDFYKQVFGRDSYDGAGSPLVSSIHMEFQGNNGCTPNNASWIGDAEQMAYGDGDGTTFDILSKGLDVTAHELTHGVTQFTAMLDYLNEPGAINEATSDILGESVEYFINGTADWKLGEDVYTPNTAGDALRYMNNPGLDDPQVPDGAPYYFVSSRDYYPDRYTGTYDHGGVHFNSGIANLAFYLLSVGGTHPNNKTNVVVPAIGIEQARNIWYRALRDFMNPTDGFEDARKATAQAASAIYACKAIQPAIIDAVHKAWDAVGAPDTSQNGWAILGLSPSPPDDTSPCIYISPSYNLLLNPTFTKGAIIWKASAGVITSSSGQPAHDFLGVWKAWLCGQGTAQTDTLYQQVTIPSVATMSTLSFWLHIDTAETTTTTAYDTLQVQLRDAANNVLATLATYSNIDKNNGYALKTFDVTSYAGQTLRVYFKGVEDSSNQTSFVVDDMALAVK
jgi:Zn-dependent metalloprotease